jgi:hypothetical protein
VKRGRHAPNGDGAGLGALLAALFVVGLAAIVVYVVVIK